MRLASAARTFACAAFTRGKRVYGISSGCVTDHDETLPVVSGPDADFCCPVFTSNSGFGIARAVES